MSTTGRVLRPNSGQCFSFQRFGTCQFPSNCRYDHDGETNRCEFSVQKVISEVPIRGGKLALRKPGEETEQTFFISSGFWHNAKAKQGDLVLLQKSEAKTNGLNTARIILVLCENYGEELPIVVNNIESAFTFDVDGTRTRDDAISIETCHKHKDCEKTGIHIVAMNVEGKVRSSSIKSYGTQWRKREGFERGKLCPALSVFCHTQCNEVSGPVLSVVSVDKYYTFGKDGHHGFSKKVWDRFFAGEQFVDKLFSGLSRRVVDHPTSWHDVLILESISEIYSKAVTEYASRSKKLSFITTAAHKDSDYLKLPRVTAFWDECDQATAGKDELAIFMSRIFQFLKPPRKESNYFPQRYQSDVESPLGESSIVKCTSPLVNFKHFLNQQILFHSFTNPSREPLYSRNDLLGLLVPRFETPTLKKTVCKGFNHDGSFVMFEYIGGQKVDSALSILAISELHRPRVSRVQCEVTEGEMAKINYDNLSCTHYCNKDLVHFDYVVFEDLLLKWKNCQNLMDIFQRLKQGKEPSPYQCKFEGNERVGTILTLRPGIELQIQISKDDIKDHGISLGLRMLRVGLDCHLCFTHVNYPEKAFMSDRNDVRHLITNETIIALQQATTAEILANSEQITAKIKWFGDYMGGGDFEVDYTQGVETGDLLCIRKEIYGEENLKYIWCCHGIVKNVTGNTVDFATCTLSQIESLQDNLRYHVTIIFPEEVKSKRTAR